VNDGGVVIQTAGLTKCFGDFTAVDRVTFSVEAGEVVGYLGPNGSGKTTTIRLLLGLLRATDGWAKVLGFDSARQSDKVRQRVGYMSQEFALYDDLTVAENLSFYAGVYGIRGRTRLDEVLALLNLSELERQRVDQLSTGWRQRVALATAIIHEPRLLFLDEPTSGVDPSARRAFWDLIYDLADQGVTAFVTTHYMDEAEYCGRVGIMQAGKLLAMDAPASLKASWLPGPVWEIATAPLLTALSLLESQSIVKRVRLAGEHLRVITGPEVTAADLASALSSLGIEAIELAEAEPTLEDVFLAMA
jgi:ABC-2 type transport system ATP-binding protein